MRRPKRLRALGALTAAAALIGGVPALAAGAVGGTAGTAGAEGSARTAAAAEEDPATLTADPLPTWQTDGIVWSVAQAHGVVYVGGTFSHVRPPGAAAGEQEVARANFAAFDAKTGALLPCAPAFTGGVEAVRAMDTSADGSELYIGGSFGTVTLGGKRTGRSNTAALNTADCTLNSHFHPVVTAQVRAVEVTDTAVYLGGDFGTVAGETRKRIAAVTPSGGALLPFRATFDRSVRAITASPADGKVLVGGDFNEVNGRSVHALVSLDPESGETNQTFRGWIESRSVVKALAHDDTYFYLGAEGTGGGAFDGRIAGVLATGARKWTDTCLGATQTVVPYKGALYSGSHAHDCKDTPGGFPDIDNRQHLLANAISDRTLLTWFPDTNGGIGEKVGPRTMVMAGDVLWVGGEFTAVNDKPQQSLTRLAASPDTGAPQVPLMSGGSPERGKVRLTWKAAWDRDDGKLTYRIYRDGEYYKSVTGESRYWDRPTMSFTDTVPSGEKHRYSLEVTDGDNLSGRNGPVYVTAK